MKPVRLVAGRSEALGYDARFDYIGVDKGAWYCLCSGIPMICAIGDFDSISKEQLIKLQSATEVICLPKRKNETDSEAAIALAKDRGYEQIYLYGGLGGRMDHTLANLYLMLYRDHTLVLEDAHHEIRMAKAGAYSLQKRFRYLSLLALEDSVITISGVAYPLAHRTIMTKDIFTVSNEIIGEALLTVEKGSVLLIQCEDEKNGIESY